MLTFYDTPAKAKVEVPAEAAALPARVNWIDAFRPDAAETARLRRLLGFEPPSHERLSEIESSSRLYAAGERLYLTVPMIYRDAGGLTRTTPLGFVLGKDNVLTVRFEDIKACDLRHSGDQDGDRPLPGGPGGFLAIMDKIVDDLADELEKLTGDLDSYSHIIFGHDAPRPKDKTSRQKRDLRGMLRNVGHVGSITSRISETLLGISRLVPYVVQGAADILSAEARSKLKSIDRDVASLSDYERHLSDKIQFLLDASLGMINVDQNDIFKILTLVSVVGIPPTLIASMYGMNFKNMPELDWTYGYPYGLAMIVLSALIPLAWFKWRGWW
jgi:magnesium transporter